MTDQELEGRSEGAGASGPDLDRARARWGPVLIVAGVAVWLSVVLVGVTEQQVSGAAWLRVPLFVVAVAVLATFAVLALRSPRPAVAQRRVEIRGGYGIDGPEQRRVRRALRDRTPLDPGDRDRALAQARRSLIQAVPGPLAVRDRYFNVAGVAYLLATGLVSSDSLTAPTFGFSDLWMFAAFAVAGAFVVVGGWLPGRLGVPGRQRREQRLRRRIEVLENHPVAS